MKNEFGVKLEANGYAPSIVHLHDDACFICDYMGELARHEIFNASNREKSKAYGLWVRLCPKCHDLVHKKRSERDKLQIEAQRCAMDWYEWDIDDFRARFGKNYIEEET